MDQCSRNIWIYTWHIVSVQECYLLFLLMRTRYELGSGLDSLSHLSLNVVRKLSHFHLTKEMLTLGLVAHTFHLSIWMAEAVSSLCKASLVYRVISRTAKAV